MPPSFQERKAKRDQEKADEANMSDQFRRARCPECSSPMLWHDGPENDRAKGVNCELTQEQIAERLNTKTADADRGD